MVKIDGDGIALMPSFLFEHEGFQKLYVSLMLTVNLIK